MSIGLEQFSTLQKWKAIFESILKVYIQNVTESVPSSVGLRQIWELTEEHIFSEQKWIKWKETKEYRIMNNFFICINPYLKEFILEHPEYQWEPSHNFLFI